MSTRQLFWLCVVFIFLNIGIGVVILYKDPANLVGYLNMGMALYLLWKVRKA